MEAPQSLDQAEPAKPLTSSISPPPLRARPGHPLASVGSATQAAVTAACSLWIAHAVVERVGLRGLGIWSVALGVTAVARIADLGMSGTIVHFLARCRSENDQAGARRIFATAFTTVTAAAAVITAAILTGGPATLAILLPREDAAAAQELLPWAATSLALGLVAALYAGAIDAAQLVGLRSICWTVTGLLGLPLSLYLLRDHDLTGLAIGQCAQAGALAVICWAVAVGKRAAPAIPLGWDPTAWRATWRYSLNLQLVGLLRLAYEPATKLLIAHTGGLQLTGMFELATRAFLQFRSLFVAAAQAMVPALSAASRDAANSYQTFARVRRRFLLLLILSYLVLATLMPSVSWFFLGRVDAPFLAMAAAVGGGWLANDLGMPSYIYRLGNGRIGGNTLAHACQAAGALVIGIGLYCIIGVAGVLIGIIIGQAAASMACAMGEGGGHTDRLRLSAAECSSLVIMAGILWPVASLQTWLLPRIGFISSAGIAMTAIAIAGTVAWSASTTGAIEVRDERGTPAGASIPGSGTS